jgi:hypothetical protein
MTDALKAASLMARAAGALLRLEGMKVDNQIRLQNSCSVAYDSSHFEAVLREYQLDVVDIENFVNQKE